MLIYLIKEKCIFIITNKSYRYKHGSFLLGFVKIIFKSTNCIEIYIQTLPRAFGPGRVS